MGARWGKRWGAAGLEAAVGSQPRETAAGVAARPSPVTTHPMPAPILTSPPFLQGATPLSWGRREAGGSRACMTTFYFKIHRLFPDWLWGDLAVVPRAWKV